MYQEIDRKLPQGYSASFGADTAFTDSKVTKILKTGEYLPVGMNIEEYEELEELLLKARQPGEWINRVLVKAFRRLRTGLGTNDEGNSSLMLVCVLLHNWRAKTCNYNQVKKVFDILEKEEQEEVQNGGYAASELLTGFLLVQAK